MTAAVAYLFLTSSVANLLVARFIGTHFLPAARFAQACIRLASQTLFRPL
jgi:hypothetical protein